MISEPRTVTVTFPAIDSGDIFDALLERVRVTQGLIVDEINKLSNNDPAEIDRITRASEWLFYEAIKDEQSAGYFLDLKNEIPAYHKPDCVELALSMGLVQCGIFVEGINSGNLDEAFGSLAYASEMLGIAIGCQHSNTVNDHQRTIFFKSAALKRHAENHAIKFDALKYYSENIDSFKSKDSAAEAIAGKIVSAKFRTVRQWITEYHKKLRSAGTE